MIAECTKDNRYSLELEPRREEGRSPEWFQIVDQVAAQVIQAFREGLRNGLDCSASPTDRREQAFRQLPAPWHPRSRKLQPSLASA